jgi:hypothetical protein
MGINVVLGVNKNFTDTVFELKIQNIGEVLI